MNGSIKTIVEAGLLLSPGAAARECDRIICLQNHGDGGPDFESRRFRRRVQPHQLRPGGQSVGQSQRVPAPMILAQGQVVRTKCGTKSGEAGHPMILTTLMILAQDATSRIQAGRTKCATKCETKSGQPASHDSDQPHDSANPMILPTHDSANP